MPAILLALLKSLLPVVGPPLLVGLLKMMSPEILRRIPAALVPVVSAVLGALIAVLSGTDPGAAAALAAGGSGAVSGLAGSKIRDLLRGKPRAVPDMAGDLPPAAFVG